MSFVEFLGEGETLMVKETKKKIENDLAYL